MPARALGQTVVLTLLALVAFAGNSVLCRLALAGGAIDPRTFTALRLASGALVLLPFLRPPTSAGGSPARARWSPFAAAALLLYALAFSLAYVTLDASVGALLLFGAVQVTMLGAGFLRGERPGLLQATGIAAAIGGFLVQVLPGWTAPDPGGAALMTLAGIAWGAYSLHGRGVALPRTATARNFLLAAPLALAVPLWDVGGVELGPRGALLAVTSGALTSGMGYVLWYAALPGHTATSAGLVQLAVPVLTAAAGVTLLGEELAPRFLVAAVLTLGGIAVAIAGRRREGPV